MKGTPPPSAPGALRAGNSTRTSLSREVSDRLGITHEEARVTLDRFLEAVARILAKGDSLQVRGWGTLYPTTRKARAGVRNPLTGEPCEPLPERKIVKFRPHTSIRRAFK